MVQSLPPSNHNDAFDAPILRPRPAVLVAGHVTGARAPGENPPVLPSGESHRSMLGDVGPRAVGNDSAG